MKEFDTIREEVLEVLKNEDNIPNVTSLANSLEYSRVHFAQLFHRETGMTPSRFLALWKIRKAAKIVNHSPNIAAKVIAMELGFQNVKNLYQFLQYHLDMNISAFKKAVSQKGVNKILHDKNLTDRS